MTLDGFGNYESGLTSFLMIGQSNMAGRGIIGTLFKLK